MTVSALFEKVKKLLFRVWFPSLQGGLAIHTTKKMKVEACALNNDLPAGTPENQIEEGERWGGEIVENSP